MKSMSLKFLLPLFSFTLNVSRADVVCSCIECKVHNSVKSENKIISVGKKVGKAVGSSVDTAVEKTEYAAASLVVRFVRLLRALFANTKRLVVTTVEKVVDSSSKLEQWAEKTVTSTQKTKNKENEKQ